MDTQSTETWISIADAAILLKVKPATVLRRIEKGSIPARRPDDNSPGHSIPDKARCVRTEVPGGAAYPGAKLILTLPVTPEPVHISEQMVSDMQSEYKSHFPKMVSTKQRKSPAGTASQESAPNGNTGTQP